MPTVLDLYDPLRSPSWRSERVEEILKDRGRLPSRMLDDEEIWRLYRFLSALQGTRTERERREVYLSDPEIWMARRLRFDYIAGGRALIEARILAGQSDEEIAKKSGTLAGAVRLFERLYFNVRDRLDARDWILRCILGPEIDVHLDEAGHVTAAQLDAVYRLLGYFGGPAAVDFIGSGLASPSRPRVADDVPGWAAQTLGHLLLRRGLISAATVRINRYNALELLQASLKLMEVCDAHPDRRRARTEDSQRTATGAREGEVHSLEQVARQIFSHISEMLGREADPEQQDHLKKYWESAVEPRLRDQVELNSTGTSPELERLSQVNPYALPEPSAESREVYAVPSS